VAKHPAAFVAALGLNLYMGNNFIAKAIIKPGQLHKDLGVPLDQNIPLDLIKKAAKRNDKTGQRARFALRLKAMRPR
jgi:hypothetical protein